MASAPHLHVVLIPAVQQCKRTVRVSLLTSSQALHSASSQLISPMSAAEELRHLDLHRTVGATLGFCAQVEECLYTYRLRLPPVPSTPQLANDQLLPQGTVATLCSPVHQQAKPLVPCCTPGLLSSNPHLYIHRQLWNRQLWHHRLWGIR